jgi:hypothetical protein
VNRLKFAQRLSGNSSAAQAVAVLLAIVGAAPATLAQNVNLEPLRGSGYGVVRFERIRPNVLTVNADIDGKAFRLLVDSGWLEDGIGVVDQSVGTAAGPSTGTQISRSRGPRAREVTLGNVRLTGVPIVHGAFPQLRETLIRRKIGANGIIGTGFLRTCSALVDLENLRLYLRPPGQGRHVVIGRGLTTAGLAEIPMQDAQAHAQLVDAEVNGVAGTMLVDTGSYLAAIDLRLAQEIGARPVPTKLGHPRPWTMTEFSRVTRIDEHASEAWDLVENAPATKLQSFRLHGVPVRVADIRLRQIRPVPGLTLMGLLGMDILGSNGAIIDFSQAKLYLYPSPTR